MEWRRQVCVKFYLPAPTSPTKQASKVFAGLKWTMFSMVCGLLLLANSGLDGLPTRVVRHARRSGSRLLYDNDTKVNHPLPAHLEPYLEFSKNLIKECGERYKRTVAVAAATDARLLLRKEHPVHCECGDQCPTRHHLTFECQSQGGSILMRKSDEENGLLVPLVTLPPSLPCSMLRPIPEFVQKVENEVCAAQQPCQFGSLWTMRQLLNGCVVALDVIGGLATFWASGSLWQASSPMAWRSCGFLHITKNLTGNPNFHGGFLQMNVGSSTLGLIGLHALSPVPCIRTSKEIRFC